MTTPSIVLFCIAALFYVFTWVYIRQLVRDVNSELRVAHPPVAMAQRLESPPRFVPRQPSATAPCWLHRPDPYLRPNRVCD